MDLLNFVLAIALIIISLQAGQTWIVFALIILSVLTFKSLKISLALILSAVSVYFLLSTGDPFANFPLIIGLRQEFRKLSVEFFVFKKTLFVKKEF